MCCQFHCSSSHFRRPLPLPSFFHLEPYEKKKKATMEKKKFGVLLCAEDSDYIKKKYGGYSCVFVNLLGSGKDDETWQVYRVNKGEFPRDEDLEAYEGFVITGSCCDAHSNDAWIRRLVSLLKTLDSMKKKVLGICFGHQVLCRALGGKTGRNSRGWDIGVTPINFLQSCKLPSSLRIPSTLNVIQFHRDEVLELPPGAEALAWSEKTKVEMYRYKDHMMGIQGHPEYNEDILLHLVDRLLQRNLIQVSHANAARDSFDRPRPNREEWTKLCRSFLKG